MENWEVSCFQPPVSGNWTTASRRILSVIAEAIRKLETDLGS
ncbi:MAG: hypothetical protein AB1657_01740 [Candidatus Micrarchaeota archaeon]